MTSTLFSPLSRGCGSWDGDVAKENKQQSLSKSTQSNPLADKKETTSLYLQRSLSIPLRAKKDNLTLICDILQDGAPSTSQQKSPSKPFPPNYVDVLRANTPKPEALRNKSSKLYRRYKPEKLPPDSPPAVRPKTAIPTNKTRVQSAASSSLSDRIKSAPARRRVRKRTAPAIVEKRALIPKTLTTRKGALLLFAAPGDFDLSQPHEKGIFVPMGPPNVSELGTVMGTTNKLASSVLQYGNDNFPSDLESFNSQYDKTCMRFVQEDDDDFTLDYRAQPGGDFVFYLRDMQARQMVRNLIRSPSHHSLSSIDTVEELNDALRSIEIEGEVMGQDDEEVRSQRSSFLITADAEKLVKTMSRPSSVGVDAISRPTTGGYSRPSTSKTGTSRPGTSKSLCSTPLSVEKLAASIKSAPYLGHPIQAPYPPSTTSLGNYQEDTRSGPGSRPESVNSIRSVTIKSRKSSARSSILKRRGSGFSAAGSNRVSEHEDDEFEQGSVAMTEGAVSGHDNDDGQRSVSRAASSHHDPWPDGGSDGELVMEETEGDMDAPGVKVSRSASSRRSRESSARRSASLKERSRSHIHGEIVEGDDVAPEDALIQSRQPSARSVKSVTVAIELDDDENWPEAGGGDADGGQSSRYGSRPASHRSQYSYASASTSVPMGSEPDLQFPQDDEQQMEQLLDVQQPDDIAHDGASEAVTPVADIPQGTKSATPRPLSEQQLRSPSIIIDKVMDPEEHAGSSGDAAGSPGGAVMSPGEDVDGVVEEVVQEVVAEADEAQDEIVDLALTDVPKAPRMSVVEAKDDIVRALRRHSQTSSSSQAVISESEEDEVILKEPVAKTPEPPPPTVEPIQAPSTVKEPAAKPKQRVMIAATPVKAKSRSQSPSGKVLAEKKSAGLDLGSLQSMVSKEKTQSPRIPPPKKEKKGGGKKKKGGGKVRTKSPPPFKMEFVNSVVVEKFEEPTAEEFEKMLQEELAQELADKNLIGLMKPDEEEKAKDEADEVNSLATDDEAIEQQIEKQMKETKEKGEKKKSKKQLAKERADMKEKRRQEKLRREEEKRELEEKKKQREAEKRRQEEADRRRREDLAEELADAEEEARMAAEAEEEARQMLQESRRLAREEREAKRKAEIEKKKMERERGRDARKKMEEKAREREREMAERLASAAERKKMREEAECERQEQDRLELEQREIEEEEERIRLQEEEDKIRELERQAEEEAMQRLIKERREAEAKRREAMKEADKMREVEERLRQEELKKQAEEEERRRRQELEEEKRMKEEMDRIAQLKLLEEKARDRVRRKIESRRQYLLKLRDKNRERRTHLNSVRQTQGMTHPWVFSYYVHWPRDTYERLRPSKKKEARRMRPKPPPKEPGDEGSKMADTGT